MRFKSFAERGLRRRPWTLYANTDLFFLNRHTKYVNGPNNFLVNGIVDNS